MDDILALYEEEQRRNVHFWTTRTEQTPDVVRLVALDEGEGAVIYSRLDALNADRVIQEQVAYFEGLGQDFEWKVYSHDTPPDLRERLIAHGFECEEPETIMALDIETVPTAPLEPVAADIRRLVNPGQIDQVVRILSAVWEEDESFLGQMLADELTHNGDYLSIYLAYVDGVPASTAWIRFHEGGQFAGLWGGSSLEAYRGRGLYTALLAVRIQEARGRGVRYLTIDASPMSRPIAARYGFKALAIAHACRWVVGKP